ncbi:MAG: aminopeptidase [Clostridia bacterium]|nr:aminopeptidase [Clostridia bacterium]
MEQKSDATLLKEQLFSTKKNGWQTVTPAMEQDIMEFADGYKDFLGRAKTEREAVCVAVELLETAGFVPFSVQESYRPGDRIYQVVHNKGLIAAVIGQQSLEKGVRMIISHVDAPRLDLKPNPLYEAEELAYFKTHYYGGIRKYQWPTVPMALHGVVVRKDGETVQVTIGEKEGDPQFVITDLLPHLGTEQNKRTLAEGIRGEELNLLIGSRPFKDEKESQLVKLKMLEILYEKYGMVEEDFVSAELEIVPAGKPVDIGLDRSMIGGYGHDDRVCAYPSLMATIDCTLPSQTVVTVLADKEEVGSQGNTGLHSSFLRYFIEELAETFGCNGNRVLSHSTCLSADVNAAFDPTFTEPYEKNNSCFLNYGTVVTKYTGARGKSGTSDASAELMGSIRTLLNKAGVVWQTGELGKVDAGGGGTVAQFIASLDVDVVDLGVPVLSMHAPFEIVSKLDVYMTYKAMEAFYGD